MRLRLWTNARFSTFVASCPEATCLVTGGDRILATGGAEVAKHWRGRVDETVDLGGRSVIPTMTDSHIHFVETGHVMQQVPLEHCASTAETVETMRKADLPREGWIVGVGFQINHFAEGDLPHRSMLDAHFPDRPVVLRSRCLHQTWVNTAALRAAGVERGSADPEGGVIVRDESGDLTGVLQEEAIRLIEDATPAPTEAEKRAAVQRVAEALWSHGITAVHAPERGDTLRLLSRMHSEGELKMRVHFLPPFVMRETLREAGLHSGFGDGWLNFGGLKVFLDGALGSQTALMHEPHLNSVSNCGVEVMPPEEFEEITRWAHAHGWTMAVHAIGDRAVERAIETLSRSQHDAGITRGDPGPWDRIEHFQCFAPGAAERAGEARIGAMMQPCHLFDDWPAVDRLWGPERAQRTYACKTLLDAQVPVALGSDAPVASIDPWQNVHITVRRLDTEGRPAGGWQAQEALSAREALEGFILTPAKIAGEAGWRGRLAPGCTADFAVLAKDPWDPEIDWLTQRVDMTVLAGAIVHDRHRERALESPPPPKETVPL